MSNERARFLSVFQEESEERIELVFLICASKVAGVPRGCDPLVAGQMPEKGGQGAKRTLEGGKRSCSPSKRPMWENERGFEATGPSLSGQNFCLMVK
jgi:hypothetical protein